MKDLESDLVLVERFSAGDRRAFESLVIRYQKPIYNAAYRVTGNPEDARDVAQTVFLKVAERLHEFDRQLKFFSWIYRIAVNESIDLLRRTRREEPLEEDAEFAAPESGSPESRYEAGQLSDRVRRALMTMKTDHRIVLTLRHFSELSYVEISTILAIDEKTVKSRLFEARQRLAAQLGDMRP
jgi:RNA polymerase sigma-70 factor (ECF subfamily)